MAETASTGDLNPVYEETIRDLVVPALNELWVATAGGLYHRLPNSAWEQTVGAEAGLTDDVAAVLPLPGGDVWAGGENAGLFRLTGGTWTSVDRQFHLTKLARDARGVVWSGGYKFGDELLRDPGGPDELTLATGTNGLPAGTVQALAGDTGGVWVGTTQGLAYVTTEGIVTALALDAGLPSASVTAIAPTGDGAAWVGTTAGLARVDGLTGTSDVRVDLSAGSSEELSGQAISGLALDRAGDLWVGTATGVEKLPIRSWVKEGAPLDGTISAVGQTSTGAKYAVGDGILYLAGPGGWTAAAGLQDRQVAVARPDHSGGILVGTETGWGIVRDGVFAPDSRCCGTEVTAVFEDDAGRIWVGTPDGLWIIDAQGRVGPPFTKTDDPVGLGQNRVVGIFAGESGAAWVLTQNGGATPFDRLANPGRRISVNTGDKLTSDQVRAGLVTAAGELWLGTKDGLNRRAGGVWTSQTDVLSGPISALADAGSGRVWVGTESHGLYLVDCSIRDVHGCAESSFDKADGLPSLDIRTLAVEGDELWIGTPSGLMRHRVDTKPPVVLMGRIAEATSASGNFQEFVPRGRRVDDKPCDFCPGPYPFDTQQVVVDLAGSDLEDPKGITFLVGNGIAPALHNTTAVVQQLTQPEQTYNTTVTAIDRHFNRSILPEVMTFATAAIPLERRPEVVAGVVGALLIAAAAVAVLIGYWWLGRDPFTYRDARLAFRKAGADVETRLSLGRTTPNWRPLGKPLFDELTALDGQMTANKSPAPAELAATGAHLLQAVGGIPDGTETATGKGPILLGLDATTVDGLETLPWEILPGAAHAATQIATTDQTTELPESHIALVRRVELLRSRSSSADGRLARRVAKLRPPTEIRVLLTWSKPWDRAEVLPAEHDSIHTIAGQSEGRLQIVDMPPHRDELSSALDQDVDIFHFIGHGEIREVKDVDQPVLLFEDADGQAHMATLKQLVDTFGVAQGRSRRPRLVILSACQSAEDKPDQPTSGLASGLVKHGIVPAAVGMGYPVAMDSASRFSRVFYKSLLEFGQVEHAVAEARESVRLNSSDKEDWLVPRLYARDFRLPIFVVGGGRR